MAKQKQIKETKATCKACGNVWFYGKQDKAKERDAKMHNASKGLMCCGGCAPALLIKDKEVPELDKCPKCQSRAVSEEDIVHNV